MIANRTRMPRPRLALGAGLLFILGSCSSEGTPSLQLEGDEPGSIHGELAVYIATFDDGTSDTRYFLRDAQGDERRLHFDVAPDVEPGARLRLWGSANGETFDVRRFARATETAGSDLGTAASALIGVPAAPPRVMCVAQVVLNGGPPADNLSVEAIEQQFHVGPKSVNAYYQENSYGKNSLGGKTYGPLPYNMTTCDTSGLAKNVKATMASLGFTGCNQYSFVMTPKATACAWAGLGQVGTSDRPATDTWYNNTLGCTATVQEPGHNYGMQHSSSITCTGGPFVDNPSATGACTHGEYGDKFDTMGGGCRHMNAWQKLYQKWWGGCNAIRVKSSGTFNIYPTETPCNGVQAIQVVFPGAKRRSWQSTTLTSYYLEYRAPIGFDEGMTPQVLVHTGVEPILPTQTNPAGVKVWIINASGDANNPGLFAGAKFSDPAGGLDIVVKSIDSTKAVVDITYSATGTPGDAGSSSDGGVADPDAGGGVPPEPVICLDGMNTVFVPPGSDECVPIYPPVNPDGGGIVFVDAAAPEAGTPPDARAPVDAARDAAATRDAAADAGVTEDVAVDTTPPTTPPPADAGPPPPTEPPAESSGCGCRVAAPSENGGTRAAAWGALLALGLVHRRNAKKRRTARHT